MIMRRFFWVLVTILIVFSMVLCSCEQTKVDVSKVDANFELWKAHLGMTMKEVKANRALDSWEKDEPIYEDTYALIYNMELYKKYECKMMYSFFNPARSAVQTGQALKIRYEIRNPQFKDYEFFRDVIARNHGDSKVVRKQPQVHIWKLPRLDINKAFEIRLAFGDQGNKPFLTIIYSTIPPVF